MINISFDNVYYLFIALPLAILLLVPFFIAIRKENKSASVITSLVLHLVIVVLIAFSAAGTQVTAVITETEVYAVADVSYSANKNLDTVNAYVRTVQKSLPTNSKLGVVCFGKDHILHSEMGDGYKDVKSAQVDDSETDIVGALEYTAGLFSEDAIKRIVLITDGKQTDGDSDALVGCVETLYAQGIYLDAMYLDDNISDEAKEVQISKVNASGATYLNQTDTADIVLQSSYETNATVSLYRKSGYTETLIAQKIVALSKGYYTLSFTLPTSATGTFDYEVRVENVTDGDESDKNNAYSFTQTIESKVNVLLLTSLASDKTAVEARYGEDAELDVRVVNFNDAKSRNVPYTVEELCKYDEIVLSNIDIRNCYNYDTLVESLDTVVSRFGKSLLTVGNVYIQNQEELVFSKLQDMLPVKYGNDDQDKKALGIVIDISRSMETLYRLDMAKAAATQLLSFLNEGDYISIVALYGDAYYIERCKEATPDVIENLTVEVIPKLQAMQGTIIGNALQAMYDDIKNAPCDNKEVFLISDGMSYSGATEEESTSVIKTMYGDGIVTSTINPGCSEGATDMRNFALLGHGGQEKTGYYFASGMEDLQNLLLSDVADSITETEILGDSVLSIKMRANDLFKGVTSLPNVQGYMYAKAKAGAITLITAQYQKAESIAEPPIYATWNYGNGKVSALTTNMSGSWVSAWTDENSANFYQNLLSTNIPEECTRYPFEFTVETNGTTSTTVEVLPATLSADASVQVEVIAPDGTLYRADLVFDSARFVHTISTTQTGKYQVKMTYKYADTKDPITATKYLTISYPPEYDAFAAYNVAELHRMIRHRGTVTTDGTVDLTVDENRLATYKINAAFPLLIAAVVLFLVDILVRKVKWKDIVGLFKKSGYQKGGKA